jgi:hypothetical protein
MEFMTLGHPRAQSKLAAGVQVSPPNLSRTHTRTHAEKLESRFTSPPARTRSTCNHGLSQPRSHALTPAFIVLRRERIGFSTLTHAAGCALGCRQLPQRSSTHSPPTGSYIERTLLLPACRRLSSGCTPCICPTASRSSGRTARARTSRTASAPPPCLSSLSL